MNKITIGIIIVLLCTTVGSIIYSSEVTSKYSTATANVKSYSDLLSTSKSTNTALQLTVS